MNIEHVTGRNAGKVMLYALSTCGWCRKTKQLLNDLGVAYDFTDVDHLVGKEKDETLDIIRKWNPACSFPTLIINDSKCIVGFDENNIRESLK
jgi:glutaredoxin-like protein NrdH